MFRKVVVVLVVGSAVAGTAGAQGAAKLDDPTIVGIFDAANTWDIQTGGLAASRATKSDIREFARMLVHDHTAVRQQGRDLAAKLGVHPVTPKPFTMYDEHVAAMKKLEGLHGEAFNKAFLANEVAYHKEVIDAVTTTLLPAISNADLKALVVKIAPAFQAHMIRAQQLLDAENKK